MPFRPLTDLAQCAFLSEYLAILLVLGTQAPFKQSQPESAQEASVVSQSLLKTQNSGIVSRMVVVSGVVVVVGA